MNTVWTINIKLYDKTDAATYIYLKREELLPGNHYADTEDRFAEDASEILAS